MSTTSNTIASTPSHAQFIANGLATGDAPPDTMCSICTELCAEGENIVKLIPCQSCYFHRVCILEWFASSNLRRGTCPNDRTVLFTSNPNDPTVLSTLDHVAHVPAVETPSERVASALRRHMNFVRDQNAVTGANNIVTAWRAAEDSGMIERVRDDILTMRYRHSGGNSLSQDIRRHYELVSDYAEADFDRLCARYLSASKEHIRTRLEALYPLLDELEQRFPPWTSKEYKEHLQWMLGSAGSFHWDTMYIELDETSNTEEWIRAMYENMLRSRG